MGLADSRPSIRIRLIGKLGNQLFQWATGFALHKRLQLPLILETGECDYRLGSFTLENVEISANGSWWAGTKSRENLWKSGSDLSWGLLKVRRGARALRHRYQHLNRLLSTFIEPGIHQDLKMGYRPITDEIARDKVLRGYFQSFRYFADLEDYLIPQLQPEQPTKQYQALLETLPLQGSLGIHIRMGGHGDSVRNANSHPTLPANYYARARHVASSATAPSSIICFTDHPAAASKLLDAANISPDFLIGPQQLDSGAENLLLMSQCTSLIGCNSTLSWWAAYMMGSGPRLRIFPRNWDKMAPSEISDLIPTDWLFA